jgi:hypothetical protein
MGKNHGKSNFRGNKKRWKERKNKWLKITTNQLTQRVVENWVKTQFDVAWILAFIKEVGDKFH